MIWEALCDRLSISVDLIGARFASKDFWFKDVLMISFCDYLFHRLVS